MNKTYQKTRFSSRSRLVIGVVVTVSIIGAIAYVPQSMYLRAFQMLLRQQITLFQSPADQPQQIKQNQHTTQSQEIVYSNSRYGFNFQLPQNWRGYTILTNEWEGYTQEAYPIVEQGPLISIRHPRWTSQKPRQDIPIMVFTIKQWLALQAGEFHVGTAPVNPSELGRNAKYVFALPARYNYAYLTGFKEVERILAGHPLSVSDPGK